VEVPKSKSQVPAELRTEADRLDGLLHALADHFGRKVVLVWPDDKEVVVEPRHELKARRLTAAGQHQAAEALPSGSISDLAENGFVRSATYPD
jgi:hypothetical protein